ncbi:hypothetical protein KBY22_04475 [Ruegeria pomeroyi]|nr:hypothetical protein [Ruegeria pomeroyi]MCE8528515.1 hypothetical protein [Ruegeria pomeroyi]
MKQRPTCDYGGPSIPETLGLRDLHEAVGAHFFMWSYLEEELRQSITQLEDAAGHQPTHGILRSLDRWQDLHKTIARHKPMHMDVIDEIHRQVAGGLHIRNRLAHGISGFRVNNGARTSVVIFTMMNDIQVNLTLAEIEATTERLGRIASFFDRVTYAALASCTTQMQNIYDEILAGLHRNGS